MVTFAFAELGLATQAGSSGNWLSSSNHFNLVIELDLPAGGCSRGLDISFRAQVQANETHPNGSVQEENMNSDASLRKTAVLVASLWLLTAIGAIAGAALINPVINAPDYLTAVFPKSATITLGMVLWLVNNIGIVFIGLLMFPILRKQSESMALGYVSMRIFEAI